MGTPSPLLPKRLPEDTHQQWCVEVWMGWAAVEMAIRWGDSYLRPPLELPWKEVAAGQMQQEMSVAGAGHEGHWGEHHQASLTNPLAPPLKQNQKESKPLPATVTSWYHSRNVYWQCLILIPSAKKKCSQGSSPVLQIRARKGGFGREIINGPRAHLPDSGLVAVSEFSASLSISRAWIFCSLQWGTEGDLGTDSFLYRLWINALFSATFLIPKLKGS